MGFERFFSILVIRILFFPTCRRGPLKLTEIKGMLRQNPQSLPPRLFSRAAVESCRSLWWQETSLSPLVPTPTVWLQGRARLPGGCTDISSVLVQGPQRSTPWLCVGMETQQLLTVVHGEERWREMPELFPGRDLREEQGLGLWRQTEAQVSAAGAPEGGSPRQRGPRWHRTWLSPCWSRVHWGST